MMTLSVGDIYELVAIVGCILLSAFFSASETAITSLGSLKAKHLRDSKPHLKKPLDWWLHKPESVLTTILVYNNTLNILASALATDLAARFSQSSSVGLATGVVTFLVLVFGEVVPKSLAKAHYEKFSVISIRVVRALYVVMMPVVKMLSGFANFIIRSLGNKPLTNPPITEEELEYLLNVSEKEGILEDLKKEMISGVIDFDETKVREVMTPRIDVQAIDVNANYDQAIALINETGHSRIPVYEEQLDNVIGILLAKDLLRLTARVNGDKKDITVREMMREAFYVPESKLISEVFKEIKRAKNHMAIVIDEYGGTAGLVTMEDLLEEIVGEIQDEFDKEEAEILEIGEDTFDMSGSINIDEFIEFFELSEKDLAQEREADIDTMAGWLTQLVGEMPKPGQKTHIGPIELEITEVDRHRIVRFHATRLATSKIVDPFIENSGV